MQRFERIHCEMPRFPPYLGVGLTTSDIFPEGRADRPSVTQIQNVLKGIARVDDPFGARWSA
jgi:hypothetical protein